MLHGLGWEFLVGTWPVPVKTGFDQNIEHFAARWKPVPKACAHKEHLNPAAVARQGLNWCWIWKGNPKTWAHPAVLAAPPQGFLLPPKTFEALLPLWAGHEGRQIFPGICCQLSGFILWGRIQVEPLGFSSFSCSAPGPFSTARLPWHTQGTQGHVQPFGIPIWNSSSCCLWP